ncbi:30S ribosomal protein S6 [Patescibacteria group bacterium]|nr:30S ribosomal protein S6 [Patescibacteria group bacterium]
MTEETKQYQIILIFPPSFNQETLNKSVQRIKKLITDQGGSFDSAGRDKQEIEPSSQLKKLSYPIDKHQEAFYLTYNLSLPVSAVDTLKQQLNLDSDLIRYLITVKDIIKEKPEPVIDYSEMIEKVEKIEKIEKIDQAPMQDRDSGRSVGKPKSQIEDLDKKLEEILNE